MIGHDEGFKMSPSDNNKRLLAVIRIRGIPSINPDGSHTLALLRLHKRNHLVLVHNAKDIIGMLRKAKDYITWGEISLETLEKLLRKRGRIIGNKKLTDEFVKSNTKFSGISELAKALYNCEIKLTDIPQIKPVFRLNSPSGGFKKSIKRPYGDGGELGYRGEDINKLIERMM